MRRSYANLYAGFSFLALFLTFSIILKLVDYRAIGPLGTYVGLATLNAAGAQAFPYNHTWFVISEICGYLNLAVAASFALCGVIELIRRRSFLKVDAELVYLGILYVVVLGFYYFFSRYVVNYRPILESDGTLEASFPSSHTLLAVSIMSSGSFVLKRIFPNRTARAVAVRNFLSLFFFCLMVLSIISRFFSGVHWVTDFLGGVLLGFACCFIFAGFVFRLDEEEEW